MDISMSPPRSYVLFTLWSNPPTALQAGVMHSPASTGDSCHQVTLGHAAVHQHHPRPG